MIEVKRLQDRAARCRRLALRASAAGRKRRSDRLLDRAKELDREAAEAASRQAPQPTPLHPFVGKAPLGGAAAAAQPLERDKEEVSTGAPDVSEG